jgi:glycerol-3-phosphate dehydrogenase
MAEGLVAADSKAQGAVKSKVSATAEDGIYDLLVVGGGINGAGIAADAAGRGLSVLLCEKADLASATSSSSTKLIHGGLRYLETYQFRLVRESLAEREVLLKAAPHIVWPLRFRLPHHAALRPVWMIRAGLFLYDNLSKRVSLPASCGLRFTELDPLRPEYQRGFEYSDCWVDDARLVVLNAMQAKNQGATILTRTACIALQTVSAGGAGKSLWQATLRDMNTGANQQITARCIVNASGPWVGNLGRELQPQNPPDEVRLVKGSHIVVPRIHSGDEAYLLQNADGRVVFVIPYEDDYSLIGTTEQDYQGDPAQAAISQQEIDYLLEVTAQYFKKVPDASDIVYRFAGVRPLIDDETANASKASRDYTLNLAKSPAPLLTVYGGKITTYRRLAESVLKKLQSVFPQMGPQWTADATLPGGDFVSQHALVTELTETYPWLDSALINAWVKRYGQLVYKLLDGAENVNDLGNLLGPGLYEREVNYLCNYEWARGADDILWRRTKLGLGFSSAQQLALDEYLRTRTN